MTEGPLIAVTGGTGFVGRHFVAQALEAGLRLRVMVRNRSKLSGLTHSNLEIFESGLGEDDASFVKGCDIVLHMAGLIKASNRSAFDAVNVEGTRHLAVKAQAEGIKRFILLSSMAARVPELSKYAASKAGGEKVARDVFKGKLAIIRAPAVFGPGDEATAPFMAAILKGILPLPGGQGWKERQLSIVAVQDLVHDIISRAVNGDYDGQTVSPASVTSLTWPEFAALAAEAANRRVKPLPLPLVVLYPIAALTSLTSRFLGRGHLTLGKLREFLHSDWSSKDEIKDAKPMQDRLAQTLAAYMKTQTNQNGVG